MPCLNKEEYMFKGVMMTLVMVCMSACLALAQTPPAKSTEVAQNNLKQAPVVMAEKLALGQVAVKDGSPETATGQGATEGEAESAEVLQMDMSQAGDVTIDFRDADIRNVLKMLSYKSGVNIIAGPDVEGVVNMQLKDVPWLKALDVILSTYGYGYERKGTVIMVTTIDNLKKRREDAKALAEQEPLATETYILNYAKAEDVLKSLDKMKTARGAINFDKRTNAIIINDVQSNVTLLRDVLKQLDSVTPQVLIEAKIIETTLDKNDTLGIDWGLSASVNGPQMSTTFPVNANFSSKFLPTGTTAAAPTIGTAATSLSYGTMNLAGLNATLQMLKSRANTNILSNPKIVTLDNQPAKVQVGQQYPMPQYTTSSQTGALQVSGWTYLDIGIIFDVTPHVNNAHMVTLDIQPKITSILSTIPASSTNVSANMPVLSTELVTTSVMIKDGETLVIAGLIKDNVSKTIKRVPILGYIPILGWPFQQTIDAHQKTDLLIFLTPHIITPAVTPVVKK